MTPIIINGLFWFVLAIIFACIEIEAEGKYGWAEKMPTWYRKTGFWAWLYGKAMSGKPLTGYHTFMFFLPLMMFHIPFFSGKAWTWQGELIALALYFAWCPVWDYLWFVLNPHYGLNKFRQDNVWWFSQSKWVLKLFPLDYLVSWAISIGLAVGARQFHQHKVTLVTLFTATLVVAVFSPLYHICYKYMRKRDDRDRAGIFH